MKGCFIMKMENLYYADRIATDLLNLILNLDLSGLVSVKSIINLGMSEIEKYLDETKNCTEPVAYALTSHYEELKKIQACLNTGRYDTVLKRA